MVRVEGGAFTPMFGELSKPRTVAPFLLDRHPVTNAEFLKFVREHPAWRRSNAKQLFADVGYLSHWSGDLELGENAPPNAAVVRVSWFAARAYLKHIDKRLPREDEWEFAALADATRADASKDPAYLQRILEWYGKPSPARLPDTSTLHADFRGVVGLHGNVWEWVVDFNNQMVTGAARLDSSLDRALFCAGGAVNATDAANYAAFMRYAFRSSLDGAYTVNNLGFRGARDLEPTESYP
jgi:formylglycine-generating enzyme required for sulfatase activity|tara:strand:- start:19904 stop:20620 length:717 start_codon:yes stop_codon:yes gene_type:complete